jgi:hypothetical protein
LLLSKFRDSNFSRISSSVKYVGREDGFIEFFVRQFQPGGMLVVELVRVLFLSVWGHEAAGEESSEVAVTSQDTVACW